MGYKWDPQAGWILKKQSEDEDDDEINEDAITATGATPSTTTDSIEIHFELNNLWTDVVG